VWKRQGKIRRERTVMSASITATLSGYHFEIIKGDDIISNRNSENEEQCKKVIKQINTSVRKMLRPFGYFDAIGTRYADEDYYGEVIEKNVGELRRSSGPCWEIIENMVTGLKILVGRAWEIKPEIARKLETGELLHTDLAEEHYHLLFPEVLTYSFLRQEQVRDEVSFEGQYNQNPRPASSTPFPKSLLLKSTVSFQEMPFRGPISQTWDFAFSKKKGRDYSTASCAVWNDKGQCFITDLIRGRFLHNDLARAVVDFAMKWRPFVIGIEDAGGSRFLEPAIIYEAQKTGQPQVIAVCSKIDWVTPDNQKDSKKMRMATLHPWLMNDRLKFASYLPHIDALYSEFERCLHSHHHDDIPDVISRQTKYAPAMAGLLQSNEMQFSGTRADAAWHLMFEEGYANPFTGFLLEHNPNTGQLNWVTQPVPNPIVDPNPEETGPPAGTQAPGLDPILGAGVFGD
jgi:phage terminase large subunit-like protein